MHLNVCVKEDVKQNKVEALAKRLLVVGDQNRLKILCIIFDEKKVCVSYIANKLGMSVAIVSHHLKSLAAAGILGPEREGKQVCYMLLKSTFNTDLKNFICRNKEI
jgi:DNA-binding transcriptional ArsR family regulator